VRERKVQVDAAATSLAGASRIPPRRWRRWLGAGLVFGVFALASLHWGNDVAIAFESSQPSRSIGTPAAGRVEHGKRLPSRGANFRAYSSLGALLGRNAVHDPVRRAVMDAYARLAEVRPDDRFVYGETGWPGGGPLPPHKTHQNGMAVDFFVPVRDAEGRADFLPTHPLNKFGYGIEFDDAGRWRGWRIDFDALAAHLDALAGSADRHGLRIATVILDPPLQRTLLARAAARRLQGRVPFSRTTPWIRHDEHYHVVFVPR
jgi:penicillin-insensitive murein endopeptidase